MSPIGEDFFPTAVLATDRRVVLSTVLGVMIFDHQGQRIGDLIHALSLPVISPTGSHILFVDRNSFIAGHSLVPDAADFKLAPSFGSAYERKVITFFADRLVVVGETMKPMLEQAATTPAVGEASLDVWVWTDAVTTNEDGYATNLAKMQSMGIDTQGVAAAVSGDSLSLAVRDNLFALDSTAAIRDNVSGAFEPLAMSSDEAGYRYLIARSDRAYRLMVLDPAGDLVSSTDLPDPGSSAITPPIVGYDHTVFIPLEGRILVVDPAGKLGPALPVSPQFAGAVVTGDGRLLVADGERLLAFATDAKAEPDLLAEFQGEVLRTAPVLLKSGRLWIATDKSLYRLTPADQSRP